MGERGRSRWIVAAVVSWAVVIVMVTTMAIALVAKQGKGQDTTGGLKDQVGQFENRDQATHTVGQQNGNQANTAKNSSGNSGTKGGGNTGNPPQTQNPTSSDQQIVTALGYNYATTERPDLNWQVTGVNVNGNEAEVVLQATHAGGVEIRSYNFQKQNGQWALSGGGSGSGVVGPSTAGK